ncbi:MAG: hypothetical protein WCJ69_05195 [Betaproteobacteria bacterium]
MGAPELPRYGPAGLPGALNVRGVHYSQARRQSLDSSRYGTGARGDEARRLNAPDVDPRIRQRVYFYVDEGAGVVPVQYAGMGARPARTQEAANVSVAFNNPDIVDWIEGFYNRERVDSSIGYRTTVDEERRLMAA